MVGCGSEVHRPSDLRLGETVLVPNPEAFMMVSVAAKELQTSPATVRRWCDSGYLECVVHPVNRYRFVTRTSVEKLKQEIRRSFGTTKRPRQK